MPKSIWLRPLSPSRLGGVIVVGPSSSKQVLSAEFAHAFRAAYISNSFSFLLHSDTAYSVDLYPEKRAPATPKSMAPDRRRGRGRGDSAGDQPETSVRGQQRASEEQDARKPKRKKSEISIFIWEGHR